MERKAMKKGAVRMNDPIHEKTDVPLPPRSKVHPSNKMKMIRIFYNALLILFLLLTVGLVVWGVHSVE